MSYVCINNLPPLFLLILFGASYVVYIYSFCLLIIKDLHKKIIFITLISIIAIMFFWSFFATMWSSVGKVPAEYKFSRNQHNELKRANTDDEKDTILEKFCEEKNLLLQTCTPTGSIRYCVTCMHIKPDRTHHCATCKTCYLKMDHHCPWLNNCIGYRNYKSFNLLIFYTWLYCFYYVITTLRHVIFSVDHSRFPEDLPISIGFAVAAIMGLATMGFSCYHLYVTGINQTTLENVHPPTFVEDDLTFDLGVLQNLIDVFGNRWYLWFLPVFSSMGNGHMFLVERK